jgi:hypothetical protein
MMSLFLAASARLLPPVPDDLKRDLRCVAVLAVANDPALKKEGGYYAAIVGANIMDATGDTRESVREMMLDEAAAVRKGGKPKPAEVARCTAMMRTRIAQTQ